MSGWMILADSITKPTWTWEQHLPMWPAIPAWLTAGLLAAAGAAMVWLIHEQRKVASRTTIITLTVIRGVLLLMLLLLMLQPALRWTHTTSSAGTLWVMLDGSRSMMMTDPQATPIERLRWADALGYLPKGSRESTLDVQVAKLTWLKETLSALRPQTLPASAGPSDPRQLIKFVGLVRDWGKQLTQVAEGIEKDPQGKGAAGGIAAGLRQASKLLSDGLGHADAENTMRAASDDIPLAPLLANLDIALRDLKTVADASDQEFLRKHTGDEGVQTGLAKTSKLSRADLAFLAVTNAHKRSEGGNVNLAALIPKYRTKVASFADSAQAVPLISEGELDETLKSALSPSGKSTNIAAGLQLISEQVGGEENASVVILSDGRQNVAADATESARLLSARGVKVYGLLLGSGEVSPDAAVEQTDAPDWIFKDDTLKATASIRLDGLTGKSLKVEFRRGDVLVDTQTVSAASNQEMQRLNFTDKPPEAAGYEYSVQVEKALGESNVDNNVRTFHVAVKKDKFFALLIDEQPRWEYQYVANYLGRDQRVKLQTVLLTPARINGIESPKPVKATPTNGQVEAQLLPETKEEWQAFDMILLGDVPPETLSNSQQQFIAQAVRDKGTTLVLMAGTHSMPARYANTPLADLLPVQVTSDWTVEALAKHLRSGFRPVVAPEGSASVLAQLGIDAEGNAAAWGKAPNWYWHSEQTLAKPSASVIWAIGESDMGPGGEAVSEDQDVSKLAAARRRALLATQAVGLGRVLYLASDQTWRLRQVNGENLQDRFWGQVINWAAGTDLPAGGRFVRFGSNRPRYTEGEPVTITARILREDLTPYTGQNFEAVAKIVGNKDPQKPGETAEGKIVDHARMLESPSAPGYYSAVLGGIRGQGSGTVEISLRGTEIERLLADDPSVTQKTLLIQVLPQLDVEERNMNTDRATLGRITQAGGGVMLDGPYADVLASHLPQLEQTHTAVEQVGFFSDPRNRWTHWVHWGFLLVFAGLLTAEWIVRKRGGLI